MTTAPSEGDPHSGRRLGFTPGGRVTGSLRTPGSKSAAQRALVAALFADGTTRVEGLPDGADVTAALALVRDAGGGLERHFDARASAGNAVSVTGRAPGGVDPGEPREATLRLGESGTLARIATAAFAFGPPPGSRTTLLPEGSLTTRSSRPLFASLDDAGVRLYRQNLPGTWPVELEACTPPSTLRLREPGSSQEVTALLLAAAAWPDTIDVEVEGSIPSLPYVGITRALLESFGVTAEEYVTHAAPDVSAPARPQRIGADERRTYRVSGPLRAPDEALVLEPDASSAAVALAAACLSGGELRVPGLTSESPQGDVRIVEHLRAFGCEARADAEGLVARGFPAHGATLDLASEPDLAPVLAAVAAGVALERMDASLLTGLETLPGKESDRIAVLARGLRAIGCRVETGPDRLLIAPGQGRPSEPVTLDPAGDHRMAFAFALVGLFAPGVLVSDPGCVAKSWRGFWDDLAASGARRVEAGTD